MTGIYFQLLKKKMCFKASFPALPSNLFWVFGRLFTFTLAAVLGFGGEFGHANNTQLRKSIVSL